MYSRSNILAIAVAAPAALGAASFEASLFSSRQSLSCSPLKFISARGTGLAGNAQTSILADPLFNLTAALVPGLTGYEVVYPADISCDSLDIGINDTIRHIESFVAECPDQKIALMGYSQGADVVYRAAAQLSPSLYDSVVAIVLFGDPNHRGKGNLDPLGGTVLGNMSSVLATRLKENCAYNDLVCTNNGTLLSQHVSYSLANQTYLANSAAYVLKQWQSDGNAGSDDSQAVAAGPQSDANLKALESLAQFLNGNSTATPRAGCSAEATSSSTSIGSATPYVTSALNGTMSGTISPSSSTSFSNSSSATVVPSTGDAAFISSNISLVLSIVALFWSLLSHI